MSDILTNADAFRRHVRAKLAEPDPAGAGPSDYDLNPGATSRDSADADAVQPDAATARRAAAVLIPVIMRPALTVLFTRRADHLSTHAGQISFPGGRIDPDDADAPTAALREAEEEIALSRSAVEPLGTLARYSTATGYEITPLLALVPASFVPKPSAEEVAETFEVPLAFLMTPANFRRDVKTWRGERRYFYAISYEHHYIWGATAGILRNMYGRLFSQ